MSDAERPFRSLAVPPTPVEPDPASPRRCASACVAPCSSSSPHPSPPQPPEPLEVLPCPR